MKEKGARVSYTYYATFQRLEAAVQKCYCHSSSSVKLPHHDVTPAVCLFVSADIRIGFAQLVYTFSEPDVATLITEVTLVREGGRLSEQTFDVAVTVGTPNSVSIRPATLQQLGNSMNPDYAIENLANNFISLAFPPEAQNVTFRFQLLSDALPEGLEAFRAETSPLAGSPRFQPGSTEIRILDDDCELAQWGQQIFYRLIILVQLLSSDLSRPTLLLSKASLLDFACKYSTHSTLKNWHLMFTCSLRLELALQVSYIQ